MTVTYSLIGDNTGSTLSESQTPDAVNHNLVGKPTAAGGAGIIVPMLGPLANNGGLTQTMALLAGSPALNLGLNPASLTTDQRGAPFLREDGSGVDMGAYEAQSLSLVVDTNSDVDDGDYSAGNLSLREAIKLANANPGADAITFGDGSGNGGTDFTDGTPDTITLAGTELPTITDAVTITGPGASLLTIDANHSSRIFNIDDGNNSNNIAVELVGMTLTGGSAAGVFPANAGGAIYSRESLTVRDSLITGSSANYGGGIYSRNYGTTTIQGSVLSGNTASLNGGGVYAHNGGTGTLTIQNSTLSGNSARYGGGISLHNAGTTTLQDNTLSGNTAYNNGGGIYAKLFPSTTTTIQNSTLSGNSASSGGGIYAENYGTATIQNSTLSKNSASYAGGIFARTKSGGTTTIQNSTVSGNSSSNTGGGIVSLNNGTTNLASSIVAGNSATVYAPDLKSTVFSGTVTVTSSLIGDNTGAGPSLQEAQPPTPDGNGNFIGGPIGGVIDPLLGLLANNGGPTLTMALLPHSPALNRGANPTGLPTDQRGGAFVRVAGGRADMGAYEYQPVVESLVVTTAADEDDGTSDPNFGSGTSLRELINYANSHPGADTITFGDGSANGGTNFLDATPDTITLGGAELPIITEAVTITGSGASLLTIDANQLSRIFEINDGNSGNNIAVEIVAMTLTGGSVSGVFPTGAGGAILSFESLTLRDSAINGNSATYGGGIFIHVYSGGTARIENSTLSGDTASFGGGIFSRNYGTTFVQNSTFSRNYANTNGGAIYSRTLSGGTTTVQNSTVSGNSAHSAGGGAYFHTYGGGTTKLTSSIIAANTSVTSSPDDQNLGTLTATFSLIGDNTGSGLSESQTPDPTTHNLVGNPAGAGIIDPKLGALADNGGPTQTMALLVGSPALNRGSNPAALPDDQRGTGFVRVSGASADMGAFEHQITESLIVTTTVDENDGSSDPFFGTGTSLREAMLYANSHGGLDTISFNIPSMGVHTISPLTALPSITDAVIIDGFTQPDSSANTNLIGAGSNAVYTVEVSFTNFSGNGLTLGNGSGGSTIQGLVLNHTTSGVSILVNGNSTGNTIRGNYIATDVTGMASAGTGGGIELDTANNTVGGLNPADRNVIVAGGVSIRFVNGNTVQGNMIGTNAAGTAALGTGDAVFARDTSNTTIGGPTLAARNVIATTGGGSATGITLIVGFGDGHFSNNLVQNNYVGLTADGTAALPGLNMLTGIGVVGSFDNQILDNVIVGSGGGNSRGISLGGSDQTYNNIVQGNLIGTDPSGTLALGNLGHGITVADAAGNTVGGSSPAERNVVVGGNFGIDVSSANNNTIQGNFVGVAADGTTAIGNSSNGVVINGNNNLLGGTAAGQGNLIAHNGSSGQFVANVSVSAGTGNAILGNSIFGTANAGGLGIDLDPGGVNANDTGDADTGVNNKQNFPVITSALGTTSDITIDATLNSTANSSFRVEFFASAAANPSGFGEGQTFLGSTDVMTDAGGNTGTFTFMVSGNYLGQVITATATLLQSPSVPTDTSEFSAAVSAVCSLIVTNTNDSGAGSLRNAISCANLIPGLDTIEFNISGAGAHTIQPLSALPLITDPVVIDGTTQTGFVSAPLIELDGNSTTGANGLDLQGAASAGSSILALTINNFDSAAIRLEAGSDGNTISGNYLGLDADGSTAAGNLFGLHVSSANNTIENNVISANNRGILLNGGGANGNTVRANIIGLTAAGTASVGNATDGVKIRGGSGNTVGGLSAADGNVISANFTGVAVFGGSANNNTIQHNLIGTKSAGDGNRGNTVGVNLIGTPGTTIQDNVVAGSKRQVVRVIKPATTGTLIENNLIGLDKTGTLAIGTKYDGIQIANSPGNTVRGNVIANSGYNGIRLLNASATGNVVQGNKIGTAQNGTTPMPNLLAGILIKNAPNNRIGGTGVGESNTVSANGEQGILIELAGAIGNIIEGNRIGTNAAGTAALGNTSHGIQIAGGTGTVIGGTAAGAGNVIGGNVIAGIAVTGGSATIRGNFIGTDAGGTLNLGNASDGVIVNGGTATIGGTTAGAGNVIAHNGLNGVKINSGTGNAILGNSIHDNAALGIDLKPNGVTANDAGDADTGANNLQNFPVLTSAVSSGGNTTISGTLNSIASSTFTVEFFSSPTADPSGFGEGAVFVGSTVVNTDGSGNGSFSPTFAAAVTVGQVISATATDASGNTSEFSADVTVTSMLMAAGDPSSGGTTVTASELAPIVDAAIVRLSAAGLDAGLLASIDVSIADLPGAALGQASGHSVTIDVDAAGWGWFVDHTPLFDEEFSNSQSQIPNHPQSAFGVPAKAGHPQSMDLLTVVMHELGHAAGLEDLHDSAYEDDLMFGWLAAGQRHTSLEASLADVAFAEY